MRKIDFNINLPEDKIFNESLIRKENPDLYEKYIVKQTTDTDMQRIEDTISNMLIRALNKVEIDKKDYREKPTESSNMTAQTNFARVINALRAHKDGWVRLEDADFKFLKEKWESAKCPVYKDSALQFAAIDEAIRIAAEKRGNPDE